jgi:hypothetical protein
VAGTAGTIWAHKAGIECLEDFVGCKLVRGSLPSMPGKGSHHDRKAPGRHISAPDMCGGYFADGPHYPPARAMARMPCLMGRVDHKPTATAADAALGGMIGRG